MRLLNVKTLQFEDFPARVVPDYAILSHTWGNGEVSFQAFKLLFPPNDHCITRITENFCDPDEIADMLISCKGLETVSQGLVKVLNFCQLVGMTKLEWVWMNSCCINKESSAELSEAINSMYNWYKRARVCWVFLTDVEVGVFTREKLTENAMDVPKKVSLNEFKIQDDPRSSSDSMEQVSAVTGFFFHGDIPSPVSSLASSQSAEGRFDVTGATSDLPWALERDKAGNTYDMPECKLSGSALESFQASRWFKRGWTLQELLAPADVRFFDKSWNYFGTKYDLANKISEITGIDNTVLISVDSADLLARFSVAERMSWAADRETTRAEDLAYSLLGIFGVTMSLQYGEGESAFLRLQKKIMKTHSDETLFAWETDEVEDTSTFTGLLAPHPKAFLRARDTEPLDSEYDPMTITSRGASIPIFNSDIVRGSTGVMLPLNCTRNNNIIGIPIAKFRGVWYRVNRMVKEDTNMRMLGHNSPEKVLYFDRSQKDVLYLSLTTTNVLVKYWQTQVHRWKSTVAIRLDTHMVPLDMLQNSAPKDVIQRYDYKPRPLRLQLTDGSFESIESFKSDGDNGAFESLDQSE